MSSIIHFPARQSAVRRAASLEDFEAMMSRGDVKHAYIFFSHTDGSRTYLPVNGAPELPGMAKALPAE